MFVFDMTGTDYRGMRRTLHCRVAASVATAAADCSMKLPQADTEC